ncbi:MAG: hypothetical protein VX672_04900 [Planctomycetota bacterium]|nr:hypothetical protein [Planctomycetota bacterium]
MALTRRLIPTILVAGLLHGCTTRTPGAGPLHATRDPPPVVALPLWKDPASATATELLGEGQPIGFAVLDPVGEAITMTRLADVGAIELWQPTPFPVGDVVSVIDGALIGSITGRIAIAEVSETDPRSGLPTPLRRAVDGILFEPSRGPNGRLAVVLGSLARFNPGERWMTEALLRDGWNVLVSSPPIASPDIRTGGRTRIDLGGSPDVAGEVLAAEFDVGIGTWAAGLAAILRRLDDDDLLPDGPMVLVGLSSGGIATPAIAATLSPIRDTSAAALLAAGADPALILARTTLGGDDLRIDRTGTRMEGDDVARFVDAYRRASLLEDPAITAWFARRPILLVEGGFDTAIPRAARERLRRRFPRATHWWMPTGHYGLFATLFREADEVVAWLDDRLTAAARVGGPPESDRPEMPEP